MFNTEPWMVDASCRQGDPELWHPEGSGRGDMVSTAKRWCRVCPVRPLCEAYIMAFEAGLPKDGRYGVWAGMTPGERHALEQSRGVVSA